MLRYRALEAKKGAVPLAAANWRKPTGMGNSSSMWHLRQIGRRPLKTVRCVACWNASGVHREAELPLYASQPLVSRARKESVTVNAEAPAYGKRKAVLYATCSMNYNDPDLGWLARQVLAKLGVETEIVYPGCCGMPQLEQGLIGDVVGKDGRGRRRHARSMAKGYSVIALVPSCALMLKLEWPLLVPKTMPRAPPLTRWRARPSTLPNMLSMSPRKTACRPA